MPTDRSRVRGCLLGGALGDALGADVEFLSHAEIVARHGTDGPADLGTSYGVPGAITDDTQMTLWTAEGSLRAFHRGATRGVVTVPGVVRNAYLRWLGTQDGTREPRRHSTSWLWEIPALHARRAPGHTCLSALRDTASPVANASKGCGTVMRMAPVGLLSRSPDIAFRLAVEIAALTHGHPTGQVAAAAFAVAIWHLGEGADLATALDQARDAARPGAELARPSLPDDDGETAEALDRARDLAASDLGDAEAVHALATVDPGAGPGWVAEECLAVAALCARRHPSDPERALRMAVTHNGDSDSTGAVCGNLIGTALGEEALPPRWVRAVELREVILQVADDLHDARAFGIDPYEARETDAWAERYPPG